MGDGNRPVGTLRFWRFDERFTCHHGHRLGDAYRIGGKIDIRPLQCQDLSFTHPTVNRQAEQHLQLTADALLVYVRPHHVAGPCVIRTLMPFYLSCVRLLYIVQESHCLLRREELDIVRGVRSGRRFHIRVRRFAAS